MTGDKDIRVEFAVAVAKNGVIGKDGDLPWRIPSDLKHFRRITMGKPVLMGRKTFKSIGKPLDGRPNVVITRDESFSADGVTVANSVEDGLRIAKALARETGAEAVSVIGGAEIYRQTLNHAELIYISEVDLEPEGDAIFPPLDPAIWSLAEREDFPKGDKDDAAFSSLTYVRR